VQQTISEIALVKLSAAFDWGAKARGIGEYLDDRSWISEVVVDDDVADVYRDGTSTMDVYQAKVMCGWVGVEDRHRQRVGAVTLADDLADVRLTLFDISPLNAPQSLHITGVDRTVDGEGRTPEGVAHAYHGNC
jgi:hypothetical protein